MQDILDREIDLCRVRYQRSLEKTIKLMQSELELLRDEPDFSPSVGVSHRALLQFLKDSNDFKLLLSLSQAAADQADDF